MGLEIEAMPYEVGKAVDNSVPIFTFSFGAGSSDVCQLLNGYDLIGAFDNFKPKFTKCYGSIAEIATKTFTDYAKEVRNATFPDMEHSYQINPEEANKLAKIIKATD